MQIVFYQHILDAAMMLGTQKETRILTRENSSYINPSEKQEYREIWSMQEGILVSATSETRSREKKKRYELKRIKEDV